MGIKAELRAPSPHKRRNKLGIANAIKKAEACIPEPKMAKNTVSLNNPKIREQSVPVIIFKMGCRV
jgi:hypothetical protein